MPFDNGYGVVIGSLVNYGLDASWLFKTRKHPPANPINAECPHYVFTVSVPVGLYQCAMNIKSLTDKKIFYRYFNIPFKAWKNGPPMPGMQNWETDYPKLDKIRRLSSGFYSLAPDEQSGAWDFCHDPFLKGTDTDWTGPVSGNDIISLLQQELPNFNLIYIFGEPYNKGFGMHNTHQNQGNPPYNDSRGVCQANNRDNGPWQDGGLMLECVPVERGPDVPDRYLSLFYLRFIEQSTETDPETGVHIEAQK